MKDERRTIIAKNGVRMEEWKTKSGFSETEYHIFHGQFHHVAVSRKTANAMFDALVEEENEQA